MRDGQSRRRRARPVLWGLLGVALVLVVLAAVYAWQARTAYAHLRAAQDRIPALREEVLAGDGQAQATVDAFAEDTSKARTAVAGPHWSALGVLPWVGPNVDAVQTVTETVDDLATDALPELVEAAEELDPANLRPRDGRVPLAPIEAAAPRVRAVHEEVDAAARRMAGIDTGALHDRLQGPVGDLADTLGELQEQAATAVKAVDLLPAMLGAEGRRHYLLVAQNNSELRALGGMPGASILVRVDAGRIRLLEQRTAGEAGVFPEPVARLTGAEQTLFGTQMGRYFSNTTSTPDFPRAARLARTMWARTTGRTVDGVVSVDPFVLQLLLEANGPVTVDGRRLTGDNAVRVLLNQVYRTLEPEEQDAFYAAAAAAVFDEVMSGADVRATAAALAEAAERGRLMVWSGHPTEQRVLADSAIGGALRGRDGTTPVVGVYLHDQSRAKLNFYQRVDVTARPACEVGAPIRVRVVLRSEVPRNIARMPPSVVGTKLPPGHARTAVLVYAPEGGLVSEARTSERDNRLTTQRHRGLHVVYRAVDLEPGARVVLDYEISTGEDLVGDVDVRLTPGPTDRHFRARALQCPT